MVFSTASLFGAGAEQMLTVRVPISSAGLWLAHRLPEFSAAHPDISVRLVSQVWDGGTPDAEQADVELRFGGGNWADVHARKVSSERIVPISAASSKRDSHDLTALQNGPLVQILGFEDMLLRYLNAHNLIPSQGVTGHAVDTTMAAIDIVAAGGGTAVVLERFALTAIKTGKPIAVTGAAVEINLAHYLRTTTTSGQSDPAKHLFEAWLEAALQDGP
jgi:LysR family glycine cleavage system transcriptional activator